MIIIKIIMIIIGATPADPDRRTQPPPPNHVHRSDQVLDASTLSEVNK